MGTRRWQDGCNLALGVWLFLTPMLFEYAPEAPAAMVNAYGMGLAIIALSVVAVTMPKVWEEWIAIALGVWLVVSPAVLGFTVHRNETETADFVGLAVIVLAAWAMLRDRAFRKWWHDHNIVT